MQIEMFRRYYWERPAFQRQDLREAYNLLEQGTASQEQLNEAFKVLLKSNNGIAQGIAFDLFFYWETLGRWSLVNPYRTFSTMLINAAHRQLQQPPIQSGNVLGANHASALGILTHLGSIEDLSLIEPILRTSRDENVIEAGLFALQCRFNEIDEIPQQLVETTSALIVHEDIDPHLRAQAIGIYRNVTSLPAKIEKLCLHIAQYTSPLHSRLPIQAAWTLGCTNLSKHRAFLESLVTNWPQDAPYPASEVHSLLEEEDDKNNE